MLTKITFSIKILLIILLTCLNNNVKSENEIQYHPIDSITWMKAVDGLNYNEKEVTPQKPLDTNSSTGSGSISLIMQILMYACIIALITFIIFQIFGREVFSKNKQPKKDSVIRIEDLDESPMESDLDRYLLQVLEKKDYRLAIRIYYLILLRNLHEKGNIIWMKNKTNLDYISEISGKSYAAQFANSTSIFEYIWYGESKIDENNFDASRKPFVSLIKTINNTSA